MTYKTIDFDKDIWLNTEGARLVHKTHMKHEIYKHQSPNGSILIDWSDGSCGIMMNMNKKLEDVLELQIPVVEEIRQMRIYNKDGGMWHASQSDMGGDYPDFSGYVLRGIFIDGKLSAKPEVIEVEKESI